MSDSGRMRLGLMLPIAAEALGPGPPVRWTHLREMARTAEAVGIDTLFLPDHLLFRKSPPDNVMQVNEHARSFRAAGVQHLTLSLVHPPGPKGIERLAPIVDELHKEG